MSVSVLDVCVYFIFRKRESQKVSAQDIKKRDKLSLKQLDAFILKMVKIRLITLGIGGTILFFFGGFFADFAILYTRAFYLLIQGYRKTLLYPARYGPFEVEMGRAPPYKEISTGHKIPLQTMDSAFYAGTGVITYRNL